MQIWLEMPIHAPKISFFGGKIWENLGYSLAPLETNCNKNTSFGALSVKPTFSGSAVAFFKKPKKEKSTQGKKGKGRTFV